MKSKRLGDWLTEAGKQLAGHVDEPRLEAQLMAAHEVGVERTWVAGHPEFVLDAGHLTLLERILARRLEGEPLPYLLGHWEYFGLDYNVSPAVLIPRPETELLVEHSLAWLRVHTGRRAADVGTGSGCIAISLAKNCQGLEVYAVDRSLPALRIANINIEKHHSGQSIHTWSGDLLTAAACKFDLLCANLPYIPHRKLAQLNVARHEPVLALDGGEDGLEIIRRLLGDAERLMAPGGLMLLEIENEQGEAALAAARTLLTGHAARVEKDLAGQPRILRVEF